MSDSGMPPYIVAKWAWGGDVSGPDLVIALRDSLAFLGAGEVGPTAERDDLRAVITDLREAYREAIGFPASEHQTRRLEAMAQRLEAGKVWDATLRDRLAQAERAVARVEAMSWELSPSEGPCLRAALDGETGQ